MSVTCRDIVRRALRKLSRVASGMEPDANDMVDGMEVLQALYLEMVGTGIFGRLYDVPVTTPTFTAYPQMRVLCNNEDGVVVTLPDLIDPSTFDSSLYGGCCCGDVWGYDYGFSGCSSSGPRPPSDSACIQINDAFSPTEQTWIYESSRANWIMLENLQLGDTAPLGPKYSEGIVSNLASRLAPEFAIACPPEVTSAASRGMYALNHRYDGQRAPVRAEYF